jgi:hypothetical protein
MSGLGRVNYRNVGLGFASGVLMEMEKELPIHSRQYRIVHKAFEALGECLKILPDELTEEEVAQGCSIFKIMEMHILQLECNYHLTTVDEKIELTEMLEALDEPDS